MTNNQLPPCLTIDNSAATNLLRFSLPLSQKLYEEFEDERKNIAQTSGFTFSCLPTPEYYCESLNRSTGIKIGFGANSINSDFSLFTDRTIDTLDFIIHTIRKRAKAVDDTVTINIDEVCNAFGHQKIKAGNGDRGGHRQKNRDRIEQDIALLESLWICTTENRTNKRGKNELLRVEQRLFTISKRISRKQISPDRHENNYKSAGNVSIIINVGAFFTRLLSVRPQIANIPLALLSYDPKKHCWEKRLGKYLYRFPNRNHVIRSIMSTCRFNLNSSRLYRVRDRFNSALQRLKDDRLIENYQYVDVVDMKSPQWFECWLDTKVQIILHNRPP